MTLTQIATSTFRYLLAPAALALLAYVAVDRHRAAHYVAKAELAQTQNRVASLESQFVEARRAQELRESEAREKLSIAQTEATREGVRDTASRSELEARDKTLDIRLKSLEVNVKEARDTIEALKMRVGASGELSRVLTALQPNVRIEIREEHLSREGFLIIDTRLLNNSPYAVVVDFPTIALSADPPRTPLTKRTVLKPDVDYELLEDRIVTGYLPAGSATFHSVVVRLKGGAPPEGVSYQLYYGVETDKHVKGIVMKYLAGAVSDLKPSDVDLMTKKMFGWIGRVSVR